MTQVNLLVAELKANVATGQHSARVILRACEALQKLSGILEVNAEVINNLQRQLDELTEWLSYCKCRKGTNENTTTTSSCAKSDSTSASSTEPTQAPAEQTGTPATDLPG